MINRVLEYDIVIVGSGIAGLYAAYRASLDSRVCLVTKAALNETNTYWAQGGIAAAIGTDDSPREHFEDTIAAGAGACDAHAVEVLVKEGPECVDELLKLGTPFDREKGTLLLTREGAHRKNRILHCGGDATGRYIQETLQAVLSTCQNVTIMEHTFAVDLLTHENRVRGVYTIDGTVLLARAVVMATGGLGQVYSRTTNPSVATGDGIAIAYRGGAAIVNMEFIQFHPTVFQGETEEESFLISEAVRGEGAVLRDQHGKRFMDTYHPLAELGPRDVVARAICDVILRQGGKPVWLDATKLGDEFLQKRFPTIYSFAKNAGYDFGKDWLPVTPAAHYAMGGIMTGLYGETTENGLYACGEVACSGVHGANRLASNSLLEGLVFARRAINHITTNLMDSPQKIQFHLRQYEHGSFRLTEELRRCLRLQMFSRAGVIRSEESLSKMLAALTQWDQDVPSLWKQDCLELKNMITVATLIVRGALSRKENCGSHYRSDCEREDCAGSKYIQCRREGLTYACIAV